MPSLVISSLPFFSSSSSPLLSTRFLLSCVLFSSLLFSSLLFSSLLFSSLLFSFPLFSSLLFSALLCSALLCSPLYSSLHLSYSIFFFFSLILSFRPVFSSTSFFFCFVFLSFHCTSHHITSPLSYITGYSLCMMS